jgi:hypothetical protein
MCECGAIRDERPAVDADGGGNALCGTGVDADGVEEDVEGFITESSYELNRTNTLSTRARVSTEPQPVSPSTLSDKGQGQKASSSLRTAANQVYGVGYCCCYQSRYALSSGY